MNRKTIAFIGGGNMGEAIISKMVSSDWKGDDIHVIDHNEEKLERLSPMFPPPMKAIVFLFIFTPFWCSHEVRKLPSRLLPWYSRIPQLLPYPSSCP